MLLVNTDNDVEEREIHTGIEGSDRIQIRPDRTRATAVSSATWASSAPDSMSTPR